MALASCLCLRVKFDLPFWEFCVPSPGITCKFLGPDDVVCVDKCCRLIRLCECWWFVIEGGTWFAIFEFSVT